MSGNCKLHSRCLSAKYPSLLFFLVNINRLTQDLFRIFNEIYPKFKLKTHKYSASLDQRPLAVFFGPKIENT